MRALEFNTNAITESTQGLKKLNLVHPCMQMLWVLHNLKYSQEEIKKGGKNAFTHADKNFARSLL